MNWPPSFGWKSRSWVVWDSTVAQFGLCDRLRAIASGLALAARLNCRFAYRWQANDECPAEWSELFLPLKGGRILPEIPPEIAERAIFEIECPANTTPSVFWNSLAAAGHASAFGSQSAFNRAWIDEVRRLKPVGSVRRTVSRIVRSAEGRPLIGIHLRRTDKLGAPFSPINPENVKSFDHALWRAVTQRAGECRDACFFLASDDRHYFDLWHDGLRQLGLECLSTPKSWSAGHRQTPVIEALTDLYLLGNCREVLGSMRCGFVNFAAVWGASPTVVAPGTDDTMPILRGIRPTSLIL
ncbi:MAG: hypothetical protein ACKV19_06950 [Verrucomicrobiales bacterium]